jgi:hypothetical protein
MVIIANHTNNSSYILIDFEKSYQAFDIDSLECKIILSGEQTGGRYSLIEIHFLGSRGSPTFAY